MGIKKKFLGILLLPFCIGFLHSFIETFLFISEIGNVEFIFFAGFLSYVFVHYFVVKPDFLSTLSHEFTHVFWGFFFGSKVKDMRVKSKSGFVNLSKTNSAIRLAPYFFPFFTFLVILSTFFVRPEFYIWIFFLAGVTLSHHLITTFETLSTRQPDVYKTGVLFSIPSIFILNLVVIILVLSFISPQNIHITQFILRGISATFQLFNGFL